MKLSYSLQLLRAEMVLTAAGRLLPVPILNPFYDSIGMSQAEIGMSQALFIAALFMCNVPTGWLADRFSRKLSNAGGDAMAMGGFVFYSLANSFAEVVVAEIVIGIGMAFSQGADTTLLRAHCHLLGRSYADQAANLAIIKPLAYMAAVSLGGIIGSADHRLTFILSAVPFFIGAILSLFVAEVGEKRQKPPVHPVRDMYDITKLTLHGHKDLAWAILASSTARELTQSLIWVLTPLLLIVGVPIAVVGFAWALHYVARLTGAWLSRRPFAKRWSEVRLFAIPAAMSLFAMVVLGLHISSWTVGLYIILGLTLGWYDAVMGPIVQRHAPADCESTIISVGRSLSQVFYCISVVIVNGIGNLGIQWAFIANAVLYAPLVVIIARRLSRTSLE